MRLRARDVGAVIYECNSGRMTAAIVNIWCAVRLTSICCWSLADGRHRRCQPYMSI